VVCLQGIEETGLEADKIGIRLFFASIFLLAATEIGRMALASVFPDDYLPVLGIIRLVQTALFLWAVLKLGRGLTDVGLGKGQIIPGIKSGLIWSACFGGAALVFFFVLYFSSAVDLEGILHVRLPALEDGLVLYFIVGGIIAPVVEEILFRGIIYGFFRRWGVLAALFFSTLFFVLSHQGFSFVQVTGGIVFAVSYEKDGRLMVPITVHALGNLSLFTLSALAENSILPVIFMLFLSA
jgi:membrane protease YdiL (CAAX protease family)